MKTQDFKQFRAALEKLGADLDVSAERVIDGMTNTGLSVMQKKTPTGDYPGGGRVTFTVKRGKRKGEEVSFYSSKAPSMGGWMKNSWKRSAAKKVGKKWRARVTNNAAYAIYVNNGHVIRNTVGGPVKGYVKGQRMLEQGVDAARQNNESLFREELDRVKREGGW